GTRESLDRIPTPAIAHVVVRGRLHHYVVLCRASRRRVAVMDPRDGRVHAIARADFEREWSGVLVLLVPGERFRARDGTVSAVRRFWRLVRPHRTVMAQALVGALLYTTLGLATAVYVQKIVDYVLVDGNRNLLNLMSVVMLALLALRAYVGSMKSLLTLHTGQRIDAELILGYYRHLMRLPQRFFDTMRVGEIISRVNDAVRIRAFINDIVLDLVVNVLIVVLSLALMCVYSWRLALIVLVMIPVDAGIYAVTNALNRANQRRAMERGAELEAQMVESVSTMATVKRLGLEEAAVLKTETRLVRLLRTVYHSGVTALCAANAAELTARTFTVIVLWIGATFALDHALTPGQLMSCYALLGYLTGPVNGLIATNRPMQDALIAADRLFEILDLEREADAGSITLTPHMARGIRLEHVAFRYGSRTPVFRDLSLTIPAGRMTAIVGESGSGKSTLAALLQRIHPLDGGRIWIGDCDIAHARIESLRRVVGVVPQQIELFAGSVLENIAVGDFQPDVRKVLDVCRLLGIAELIEALPGGLGAPLGEHGVNLSGGQRQRIAIARALYRDPQILILDEATSSLDTASERCVQRAIHSLVEAGKTVIVIAHRLSTVAHADKLVVLERGAVVEEGTPAELLEIDRQVE
ncbi:MAG TPA: peptidase domain-containing ABC transporter, partial [Gemmatimonadaceae bacterium]|nr:peptidase domain-containing ABC transporter [Gemmatimonadaceae bacterium]